MPALGSPECELIQKLKKGQYGVPWSLGDSSLDIWTNVLQRDANSGATQPDQAPDRRMSFQLYYYLCIGGPLRV